MDQPVPYLDLPAQIRSLRGELDAAIARTLDYCGFCLGPEVAQFETDFAAYCGAQHAVGFNSGTSAPPLRQHFNSCRPHCSWSKFFNVWLGRFHLQSK